MKYEEIKDLDLAYIAGFFDGEGSITIHENCKPSPRGKNPNHTMQVSIGNTNPKVLLYLKNKFGGCISYRKPTLKPNHRNVVQWTIRAKLALPFLIAIKPYIQMKKKQINLAIKFQKTKKMNKKILKKKVIIWREKQRKKIRELNHMNFI